MSYSEQATGSAFVTSEQLERRCRIFTQLGWRLNDAATVMQAAEIILAAADELLGWDSSSFSLYSNELDKVSVILAMVIVDGCRTTVPLDSRDTAPTPRQREIILRGAGPIQQEKSPASIAACSPLSNNERPAASTMSVPIRTINRIAGILSIQSHASRSYTEEQLNILQALADYCGGTLGRIQADERYCSILRMQLRASARLRRLDNSSRSIPHWCACSAMNAHKNS